MKKLIAMLMLAVVMVGIIGCRNNNDYKRYLEEAEKKIENERKIKDENLKIASDSVVNLSFSGLELGKPASKQIQDAIKENRIKKQHTYNGKNDTYEVPIYLPTQDNPIYADLVISTYNDTIASLCVTSQDFETKDALIELYISKYDNRYADEGFNGYPKSWKFKNQTLTISLNTDLVEEVYVKDERMKHPENRYGKKYTTYFLSLDISYSDNRLSALARQERDSIAKAEKKREVEEETKRVNQRINKATKQDI